MKLIGSTTSPYVRKIRVMLAEKGLHYAFVNDSPWETATHVPDYNPLGKVPALVADDGRIWFDSPVVAEYVETLDAAPYFLPRDAMARVEVRQLAALADGIVDAGVTWLLETRRPQERQDPAWIERQRGKVERGLAMLDRHAAGKEWLHGDAITLADISAACMLGWLDFRHPGFGWRQHHAALAAHAQRMFMRPSFMDTMPG